MPDSVGVFADAAVGGEESGGGDVAQRFAPVGFGVVAEGYGAAVGSHVGIEVHQAHEGIGDPVAGGEDIVYHIVEAVAVESTADAVYGLPTAWTSSNPHGERSAGFPRSASTPRYVTSSPRLRRLF